MSLQFGSRRHGRQVLAIRVGALLSLFWILMAATLAESLLDFRECIEALRLDFAVARQPFFAWEANMVAVRNVMLLSALTYLASVPAGSCANDPSVEGIFADYLMESPEVL